MRIYKEDTLNNFKFWGGAKDNAEKLTYKELEELTTILDEIYTEGVDESLINDWLWFEFPDVCETLGLEYDEDEDEILR